MLCVKDGWIDGNLSALNYWSHNGVVFKKWSIKMNIEKFKFVSFHPKKFSSADDIISSI